MRSNYIQVRFAYQSSLCFEIGDFVVKDESGNALLVKWLSHRFLGGFVHKTMQMYEEKLKLVAF